MPTRNRRSFVAHSIALFEAQDYPNKELLVLDDGEDAVADLAGGRPGVNYEHLARPLKLGAKRNLACQMVGGGLIAHWDDDDWYAPWRLGYQVAGLLRSGLELSGSDQATYYNPWRRQAWRYSHPDRVPWLSGNSLLFTRQYWERNRFADVEMGEDALFARSSPVFWAHVPSDHRLCVGIVHGGNAAPKLTTDKGWAPIPVSDVISLLGSSAAFYHALEALPAGAHQPVVSCVMPTGDRRRFIGRAIHYFLEQSYPARELIVVDDGADPVGDLIPSDPRVRYVRLRERTSIGTKRNLACAMAEGEVILQWDDDDWHGPDRIAHQVADIASQRADVTGLDHGLILELDAFRFWSCRDELHARMFFQSQAIHGGTLAFRKSTWARAGGYPDGSLAEDAEFLRRAMQVGARVRRLANNGHFVYVRHGANAWNFDCGAFGGQEGWIPAGAPGFMPAADLAFYAASARPPAVKAAAAI
jgi:glycosyltransferase involved in cell wall biosynthesis